MMQSCSCLGLISSGLMKHDILNKLQEEVILFLSDFRFPSHQPLERSFSKTYKFNHYILNILGSRGAASPCRQGRALRTNSSFQAALEFWEEMYKIPAVPPT